MSNIQPLHKQRHSELKVRKLTHFQHLADEHLVPVVVQEFVNVCTEFPIVFVRDSQSGQFIPVALMGLEAGKNLYCRQDPWPQAYLPAALRNHPFSLRPISEETEKVVVCINEDSPWVSKDEGEALFGADGKETEYLNQRAKDVVRYAEHTQITRNFTQLLVDRELLVEQDVSFNGPDGKTYTINGLFLVNEEKLNALPDDDFNELRKKGVLAVIYAQLISMHQINRLARLHLAD